MTLYNIIYIYYIYIYIHIYISLFLMRMIYRVCEMVKAFVCESQSANIHKLAMYRNGGPAGTKVRWMPLIRLFLPQWSLSLEFNLIPVPRPRQTSACWKMDLNSMHKAEATALNAKYIYIGLERLRHCKS